MTRIGATPSETSCLISNLFTEIRPVCGHCEGDSVVLCGVTYEGQEETVVLRDYGFDYSGDPKAKVYLWEQEETTSGLQIKMIVRFTFFRWPKG